MIEVVCIYAFPCSPPCKRALSAQYSSIIQNAIGVRILPFGLSRKNGQNIGTVPVCTDLFPSSLPKDILNMLIRTN